MAERTAPNEKNTERAVTRYCLDLGMCSRRRVPSVGIEPPTELPRKKRARHRVKNELEKVAKIPKTAVKNRVALNAIMRPIRSEPVGLHPIPVSSNFLTLGIELTSSPANCPNHHPSKH